MVTPRLAQTALLQQTTQIRIFRQLGPMAPIDRDTGNSPAVAAHRRSEYSDSRTLGISRWAARHLSLSDTSMA